MTLGKWRRRDRSPADAAEVAGSWSARRRLGLLSSAEEQRFQRWLQEPAHRAEYEALEATADLLGAFAADPEILKVRADALAASPAPYRLRAAPFAIAALTLAVGAIVTLSIVSYQPRARIEERSQPGDLTSVALRPPARYVTGTGETRAAKLADGSIISLNTASIVEVDFSSTERGVRLVAGQAMFQVAKDSARPFVVKAGDRRITAVGTAFDVRVNRDSVSVVLVEGHVVVDSLKPKGLARIIPAFGRYDLTAGEQLVASAHAPIAVTTADTERATSWKQGQIIFRDDTIADAIAEMNRYSATQLVVDDPQIQNLRISGVFKTTRPENFVAALTSSYPIRLEKRSLLVEALVRRD